MSGTPRRRPRTTVIMMVLLSLTVLTMNAKDVPVLGSIRSGVIDAMGPVERGFRSFTKPVRSWWGGATDYDRVVAENRTLREEVARLKAKQLRNATAEDDLQRLKEQEGIPFVGDIPSRLAQVATGPYSSFDDSTIMIDRGASSGFKVGMPVVTSLGLVGRLQTVTDDRSVVQLITDPDMVVSVKLASSGNYAQGHGAGPENPFVVDREVELDQKVEKGEYVVTSGLETAAFPADIPVGTVSKVTVSQSDLSQVLDVRLSADLVRLFVVRVLLWEPPK